MLFNCLTIQPYMMFLFFYDNKANNMALPENITSLKSTEALKYCAEHSLQLKITFFDINCIVNSDGERCCSAEVYRQLNEKIVQMQAADTENAILRLWIL